MRNVSGEFYNYNNPIINPQAMPVDYYASDKFTVSAKSFVVTLLTCFILVVQSMLKMILL